MASCSPFEPKASTELTRDTTEDLRRAGLSHLLAVSGSNVAIVLGAVMLIGRGLSLVWRIVLGTVSLTGLVLTVGPDPSVLRAAAMGIVALAALGCGRRTEPIQTLGVALIGLLAARPTLLYSVGLHLSVAASAGIVLWAQPLARRLKRLPSAVAAVLSVTLAAQAAVAPVVIGTFGELSLVAPVANLLALPAVPPATILAVSAGVVGLVDGRSAAVLGGLTEPFAAWILVVGHTTASPGWAALEVARSTAVLVALPVVVLMMASLRRILRGRDNPVVASWRWTVHDVTGRDIAVSEEFDSKQDAEAWMGREWASLRDQGGESVSLSDGDALVYRMGLGEE